MRMLVLGAGLQGSACAYDLLQRAEVERVTLADLHPRRVPAFLRKKDKRLVTARLDAKQKSTRLNSSHDQISYAVFCLKKKKKRRDAHTDRTKMQARVRI